MANFTRGTTFASDAKLTPAGLNALVEAATVTDVSLSELGADFRSMFYGNSDPGLTNARIWYDTTAGQEGLKYAYVSPSNASVAAWLYATPRREAIYWCNTAVSVGSPLMLGRRSDLETSVALHLFDGLGLMKVYTASGSTGATEASPVVVVAMESRSDAGPLRCAWAGLIPADTFSSNVTQHFPIFIDHHNASKFTSVAGVPFDLTTSLQGHWHLDGESGSTRTDIGPNGLHLWAGGVANPAASSGQIGNPLGASSWLGTTERLRENTNSNLLDANSGDMSYSVWVWLDANDHIGTVFAKNDSSDGGRGYSLIYHNGANHFIFDLFDGTGTPQTNFCSRPFSSLVGPDLNRWYNVQGYWDDTVKEGGIRVNTLSASAGFDVTVGTNSGFDDSTPFTIGRLDNAAQPWEGGIDELLIWQGRRLTTTEFNSIWQAGVDGVRSDTIVGSGALARSSIFGVVMSDQGNATSVTLPAPFVLWGTGAVVQDIDQRSS